MKRLVRPLSLLVLTLSLAACANNGGMYGSNLGSDLGLGSAGSYTPQALRYGAITAIAPVAIPDSSHYGIGAVLGAVAGGLLGKQIGGGSGSDVAAVLGALGGGYLGHALQQRQGAGQSQTGQYITVRLRNGVSVGVTQPDNAQLFVGQNVVIEGSGQDARVIAQ